MKTGHNTSTCRARIECIYCIYATKPSTHNSALCAFLTDCQFEAIMEIKAKLNIGGIGNQSKRANFGGNKHNDMVVG